MYHHTSKSKPIISIIIPAYNEQKLLPSCINSLKKQVTTVPYEIIVVNNNSTDKTQWIAKKAHVRVVDEMKKGAPAARNAGARISRGSLLVFIDADCQAPKNYINMIAKTFSSHPTLDVLGGPYVFFDAGFLIRFITEKLHYYQHYYRSIKFLSSYQLFTSGNVVIKKTSFQRINGFNENIQDVILAEDVELACRVNKKNYFIRFDPNLVVFTSFRRTKTSPLSGIVRSYYMIQHILASKLS